jgi:elongator complex protein 3
MVYYHCFFNFLTQYFLVMDSILKKNKKFAKNIIREIISNRIKNQHDFSERRFFWSKTIGLTQMPSNPYILSEVKNPSKKILSFLSIKPTRSLSGVQVIAVMLPPFKCPGKCSYCPSQFEGKKAPQSYTGFEPSTMRAQRNNYDPFKIVDGRIKQLDATGNFAEKIELIFQGSSFTALNKVRQEKIVKASLDAVTGKITKTFELSKKLAERSKRRVVGITYETRPDLCGKTEINQLLHLAGTRVELGVQNPDDLVYQKINRGHLVQDVIESTQLLKDSAFKVLYHLMPGLPGSSYKKDLKNFEKIFTNPLFCPDMVKFYPTLVLKNTCLYDDWKKGVYVPLSEKKAINLLAKIKPKIPKWVRVMRVNRDIPSTVIEAGPKLTNLRQMVHVKMKEEGVECNCIRCREAGLKSRDFENKLSDAKLMTEEYFASLGKEIFISYESKKALFGFARLRIPHSPFRPEITKSTAIIRELHVYGKTLGVGKKGESIQHKGVGKLIMAEAEKIAKEKFDAKKMVIISGLGVKEYYIKNFGYKKDGPYVSKKL